jgi:hypothetical protein
MARIRVRQVERSISASTLNVFSGNFRVEEYTMVLKSEEFSSIRPLVDWLDYNGYTVVTKVPKEFTDISGNRKFKGNMDVKLAIDAVEMADHVDQIVLFSGDRCRLNRSKRFNAGESALPSFPASRTIRRWSRTSCDVKQMLSRICWI